MSGRQRKYNLLYLPAGKLIEVLGPNHPTPPQKLGSTVPMSWHTLAKNRSDLKTILNRIMNGQFAMAFYQRNDMVEHMQNRTLKSCHFVFQRADFVAKVSNETEATVD
jgi:hypothetical protein